MITKVKYLYQYGNASGNERNIVLPKGFSDDRYTATANTGVKTIYAGSNNLGDGDADLIPNRIAFKEAYIYDVTFPIGEYERSDDPTNPAYDIDVVNSTVFDKPKYMFAYSTDKNGNIDRFLYTPNVRAIATPAQFEEEWNNVRKSDFYYSVSFKPLRPYWYDCTDFIDYYNYTEYIANLLRYDVAPQLQLDTTDTWDAGGSTGSISGLTQEQMNTFFSNWNNKYLLSINDRFFGASFTSSMTNYIINSTFSTGTTDVSSADVLTTSNARNDVYLIDFEPLLENESLEFTNLDNNSGIKITWVDPSANANSLRFNSYTGVLYDKSTSAIIDQTKYQLEVPSSRDQALFWNGDYNPRSLIPATTQNIRVVSTASSSNDITIDILPTIH